jgi:hypothetical protein
VKENSVTYIWDEKAVVEGTLARFERLRQDAAAAK